VKANLTIHGSLEAMLRCLHCQEKENKILITGKYPTVLPVSSATSCSQLFRCSTLSMTVLGHEPVELIGTI